MKRYLVAVISGALLGLTPLSFTAQAAAPAPEKAPDAAWSAPQQRSARAVSVQTKVVMEGVPDAALYNVGINLAGVVAGQHPTDMTWHPVPTGSVTLHRRWKGTTAWLSQGAKPVDENGQFAYSFTARRNADYRVTFSGGTIGDYNFAPSSTTRTLGVARRFNESITKRTLIFRGRIAPSFARKAVVIERRTCATCSWRRYAKIRTDRRSRWSKKLVAPRSLGQRYYYRAVTPASSYYIKSFSRTAETFRSR